MARIPRVVGGVAAIIVACLAVVGFFGRSGPTTEPLREVKRVVILSVPGLRWQDLEALDTPNLERRLMTSALLSIRSVGPETSLLEGYLALNAGNRLEVSELPADALEPERNERGWCLAELAASATASADGDLNGARPGALGEALRAKGLSTAVYGGAPAIAALMDESGCVVTFAARDSVRIESDVTLVEYLGLEATDVASDRTAIIGDLDAAIGRLDLGGDIAVIVVAPSAVNDRAEVTVVGVDDGAAGVGDRPERLTSAFTRRAGYVTITDLAPTVLQLLGADAPDAMSGAPMTRTGSDASDAAAHIASFADLADRVMFRDRAVGPVSVVFVVLLALCGAGALGGRRRIARMLAPVVVAYPVVAFGLGATAYHRLPLGFYVCIIVVLAAVLASVAASSLSRLGRWAPTAGLSALLWALLVVDVVTGGRLQINTPFGYTPTIAGRFQGFGNLAFGLVGSASVVTAVVVVLCRGDARPQRAGATRVELWWAAWVGAISVVSVAAPAFGSDVGGTLALLPAFAMLGLSMSGRTLSWRRGLVVVASTAVAVVGLALADLARPADARTHLGRFADDLLHGEGMLLVRRKLRGNMAILTSSFWSVILVALIIVAGGWCWHRRSTLAASFADHPAVRHVAMAGTTAGALGFALNDSGLAVPAIMLGVFVPWLVAVRVPVATRAPR